MACQAVRLSLDGQTVELRSFPFWALSLEAARLDLMRMVKEKGRTEMPYTHIFQYGILNQVHGKKSRMKIHMGPKSISLEGKTK